MRFGRAIPAALALPILAFAADPFLGKWQILVEKGSYQSVPKPKSGTLFVEAVAGGLKIIS
jgi:hypothetical protein